MKNKIYGIAMLILVLIFQFILCSADSTQSMQKTLYWNVQLFWNQKMTGYDYDIKNAGEEIRQGKIYSQNIGDDIEYLYTGELIKSCNISSEKVQEWSSPVHHYASLQQVSKGFEEHLIRSDVSDGYVTYKIQDPSEIILLWTHADRENEQIGTFHLEEGAIPQLYQNGYLYYTIRSSLPRKRDEPARLVRRDLLGNVDTYEVSNEGIYPFLYDEIIPFIAAPDGTVFWTTWQRLMMCSANGTAETVLQLQEAPVKGYIEFLEPIAFYSQTEILFCMTQYLGELELSDRDDEYEYNYDKAAILMSYSLENKELCILAEFLEYIPRKQMVFDCEKNFLLFFAETGQTFNRYHKDDCIEISCIIGTPIGDYDFEKTKDRPFVSIYKTIDDLGGICSIPYMEALPESMIISYN